MKKSQILDSVLTPDGRELVLYQRDDRFTIRVDDIELMSNRAPGSEEKLARLGLAVLGPAEGTARSGRRPRHGLHAPLGARRAGRRA